MGQTLNIPQGEQFTGKTGSVKPKKLDKKLDPTKRQWSDNVMKALGLSSGSSQARVLAGAIASAALVEQHGSQNDKDEAKRLRETVLAAGTPPWKDARKAMAAGDAKVKLDLLSIPPNQRQLAQLNPNAQGVHQAFWVQRQDADGQLRDSFLCKPASDPNDPNAISPFAPSGALKGGEVAREALTGRAAQLLLGQTGIDIGMPESHVVKLSLSLMGQQGNQEVICSVQEARKDANRSLNDLTPQEAKQLDAKQIAGLAIFDTMTLNVDRHGGNVLIAPNGDLVPIDHGESFIEPTDEGIGRLKAAMCGPQNSLLTLPAAHEPLPPDMIRKLKGGIDPEAYAKGLTRDNVAIGSEHPEMANAISPGAIDVAKRAARFVKLAARAEPPLSPAQIQIAMGSAADHLFDPAVDDQTFETNARAAIQRVAGQGPILKEICTAPDVEWNSLKQQAEALGWNVARRYGEPSAESINDPIVLMKIVKQRKQAPVNINTQRTQLQGFTLGPNSDFSPDEAFDTMLQNRVACIRSLIALCSAPEQRKLQTQLAGVSNQPQQKQPGYATGLLQIAIRSAVQNQTQRLQLLVANNRLDDIETRHLLDERNAALGDARGELARPDPVAADEFITYIDQKAAQGEFIPKAARAAAVRLRKLAVILLVPADDADLTAGLQAAGQGDPFGADDHLQALKQRAATFEAGAKQQIQADLDEFNRDYTIPQNNENLAKTVDFLQKNDLEQAFEYYVRLAEQVGQAVFAPSVGELPRLAAALGVPVDDAQLATVTQAVNANSPAAAREWKTLLEQVKAGDFGGAALQDVQRRLQALLDDYQIPAEHKILRDAQEAIRDIKVQHALVFVAKLERLAAAGAFPEI